MKTSIDINDIKWEMDWREYKKKTPTSDLPDFETIVENGYALALLLINDVISVNSFWWEKSWPKDAQESIGIFVDCSDVFAWGCSDAEQLFYKDIEDLYDHYMKDNMFGPAVWCMKKRCLLPQKPVYNDIMKQNIWNLDEMNLDPNPTWK